MGFNSVFKGLTSALDGSEWSIHTPVPLPPGKNHYTRSGGRVDIRAGMYGFAEGKLLPLMGFEPRTIQLLASRNTDFIPSPSKVSDKAKLHSSVISILFVSIRNSFQKQ